MHDYGIHRHLQSNGKKLRTQCLFIFQSKEAGIKTLVMLDDQGGLLLLYNF